jgi:hypothetical protein
LWVLKGAGLESTSSQTYAGARKLPLESLAHLEKPVDNYNMPIAFW